MFNRNNLLKLSMFALVLGIFIFGLFTACSNKDPQSTDEQQFDNELYMVPGGYIQDDDGLDQPMADDSQISGLILPTSKGTTGLDGYCGLHNSSHKFRGVKATALFIDMSGYEVNDGDFVVEHMVYVDGSGEWAREIVNAALVYESNGNKYIHCWARYYKNGTAQYLHSFFTEPWESSAKFRFEILAIDLGGDYYQIKHTVKSYQSGLTYVWYSSAIRDTEYDLTECNQIDLAFENRCESDLEQSSRVRGYALYGMNYNSSSWTKWKYLSTNWFTNEREDCYDNLVDITYSVAGLYLDIKHLKR